MTSISEQEDRVVVRNLRPEDFESVVRVDAKNGGKRRDEYFKVKLAQNLAETGVKISLASELQDCFAGFLLARVYYGEFGEPEHVAVLDTFGVHPEFRRRGIGSALLNQLCTNLGVLGVRSLHTEVGWNNPELITFFQRAGFRPADRFCLDLDIGAHR